PVQLHGEHQRGMSQPRSASGRRAVGANQSGLSCGEQRDLVRRLALSHLRSDHPPPQQHLQRDPAAMTNRNARSFRDVTRQRGVVLFVALIAMVILSLAGLALMRSIDESTGVAGNLAFRHSSMNPVNQSIEEAIAAIFKQKTLPDQIADHPANNYFAELQPGESKSGVPAALQ